MMRRFYLATLLLTLCLFAAPLSASASPFSAVCSSGGASSTVCQTGGQSNDPLINTLGTITNIVAYVGGAAAIIVMVVSALRLVTSGSDVSTGSRTDTDVEDARRGLGGAVIGLAIIVLGRILILYVLNKL